MRSWLLALFCVACLVPGAQAALITVTDTQPILDFPISEDCPGLPAIQPFALFDFTGQPKLSSLTGIEITLTMEGGDTALGDFDYGNLSLGLDNVPTGILLNGFAGDAENTLTFSLNAGDPGWLSEGAINDLLMDLYSDNQLFGLILDATPDDNCVNLYSFFDTTLRLTGTVADTTPIPEPATWLLWSLMITELSRRIIKRRRNAANPLASPTSA